LTANWLASLPESERLQFLASLSHEEREELFYKWSFWARDAQISPPGDWRCWLILAGRGFGKTRIGAEVVRAIAETGEVGRIGLIGQTAADVRDVMVEGESGILEISPPWFRPKYEPSKRRLTWPNGVKATTFSGDEPDQLRGPQHGLVWADEPAKWKYPDDAWSNMEFGLRTGDHPRVVATTTPRPIKLIRELVNDPTTHVTRGSTYDNYGNLAPSFIQKVLTRYEGTRLGRQELLAEILDDNPGALWQRSMIDALRVKTAPDLFRIVVAVDPMVADVNTAANLEDEGSACGIVVFGVTEGPDGHGYVLEDKTVFGSPNEWAATAVNAYLEHKADRIVAETNQGGAMVDFTIRTVARDMGVRVSYRGVHASRGKYVRAEPVAALYEQKRVHHVGSMPDLEDELCNWEPGQPSPNRLDALVWGATDTMVENVKRQARTA